MVALKQRTVLGSFKISLVNLLTPFSLDTKKNLQKAQDY